MADFVIKRGDTLPNFKAFLSMADGSAVPITDGVFTLVLKNRDTGNVVRYVGTATTVTSGIVRKTLFEYSWKPGDTDFMGEYDAKIEIAYPKINKVLSVPNHRSMSIEFTPEI